MSCNIDKILFNDSLNTAREKINEVYTGSTQIWSGGTGVQSIVSVGNNTNFCGADYSSVISGENNQIIGGLADNSVIIGGENNSISGASKGAAILGGQGNVIDGASYSVIVAGSGITATDSNTVYTQKLVTTGARHRNVRYIKQVDYTGGNKRPSIADDDEIIFIEDQTTNAGTPDVENDFTLSLNNIIVQNRPGRFVDIVLVDNQGFLSTNYGSTGGVGSTLLGTESNIEWRINDFYSDASSNPLGPYVSYGIFEAASPMGGPPFAPPNVPNIGQVVRLIYIGNDSGIPFFVATGTGVFQ